MEWAIEVAQFLSLIGLAVWLRIEQRDRIDQFNRTKRMGKQLYQRVSERLNLHISSRMH